MPYLPCYMSNEELIINHLNKDSFQTIRKYFNPTTIIVCIGTDIIIGDCLGPMVGTLLKERNFPLPVFGTLEHPVHAQNIKSKLNAIKKQYPDATIVAVDACICKPDKLGHIVISEKPVYPGKGLGKTLPSVGDVSILGGTYSSENKDSFLECKIRLSFVWKLAYIISYILQYCYEEYIFKSENCSKKTAPIVIPRDS